MGNSVPWANSQASFLALSWYQHWVKLGRNIKPGSWPLQAWSALRTIHKHNHAECLPGPWLGSLKITQKARAWQSDGKAKKMNNESIYLSIDQNYSFFWCLGTNGFIIFLMALQPLKRTCDRVTGRRHIWMGKPQREEPSIEFKMGGVSCQWSTWGRRICVKPERAWCEQRKH